MLRILTTGIRCEQKLWFTLHSLQDSAILWQSAIQVSWNCLRTFNKYFTSSDLWYSIWITRNWNITLKYKYVNILYLYFSWYLKMYFVIDFLNTFVMLLVINAFCILNKLGQIIVLCILFINTPLEKFLYLYTFNTYKNVPFLLIF